MPSPFANFYLSLVLLSYHKSALSLLVMPLYTFDADTSFNYLDNFDASYDDPYFTYFGVFDSFYAFSDMDDIPILCFPRCHISVFHFFQCVIALVQYLWFLLQRL